MNETVLFLPGLGGDKGGTRTSEVFRLCLPLTRPQRVGIPRRVAQGLVTVTVDGSPQT